MNILSGRTFFHVVSCGLLFLVMAPHMGFAQVSEIESLKALVRDMQQQLQKALSRIDQFRKRESR